MHKKTVRIIQAGIYAGGKHNERLQEWIKEWDDPKDIATRTAQMLKQTNLFYMKILSEVLSQIDTDCKHPKKMQDTYDGVTYCMNCNLDLDAK